jgi:hypothetical protein
MKRNTLLGMLVLSFGFCSAGFGLELFGDAGAAGWPTGKPTLGGRCVSQCGGNSYGCCGVCCCPDTYCPKRPPCVRLPQVCGHCDDYCPKPFPCVRVPQSCGRCDDYCPKKAPCIRWPPPCGYPKYYRCAPAVSCCR